MVVRASDSNLWKSPIIIKLVGYNYLGIIVTKRGDLITSLICIIQKRQ